MPEPSSSSTPRVPESAEAETTESFDEALSKFEQAHARKPEDRRQQLEGTVVAVTPDSAYFDIGYKTEGILPLTAFGPDESVKPGDKFPVSVTGRNPEGYYELSRSKVRLPTDWPALEQAFADKAAIVGTVTAVVKGGLSVDIGVRAFMPASRSGTRDAVELEKMVGQEIRCRITKLDVTDEDVVVDRRAVLEEEARADRDRRYGELTEGATVEGTVRSITDYGAFVDIGGVDALLHVGDISWSRINKPSDVLSLGQEIKARVLKNDVENRRISIGLKQLQPHPWEAVAEKYRVGDRIRGTVTRIVDFGAFVEIEPGVEGLIHISELSWTKRIKKASDVVKRGEAVEAIILAMNPEEHRISLGLKQALGDPWAEASNKLAVGSIIEGPVTNITNFGAFVQVTEGIEGMIHVSEISAEKRINHPKDALKVGQIVKAQVIGIEPQKRQLKLSIKQMVPTSIDEYLAEHRSGDVVTGRIVDVEDRRARVELGEGIQATCRLAGGASTNRSEPLPAKADLSSLTSMLSARWKGTSADASSTLQSPSVGQIRSFRITQIDAAAKTIELELA